MKRRTMLAASVMAATLPARWARAADYPDHSIKLVVPFAPGGTVDFIARAIVGPLSQRLGQTVVVFNRGGAGGGVGTLEVTRSPADGYTLLMASPSVTAANPAINPNAGYDPTTDLTAIVNVAASPTVICVRPGFPATNFKDFVAEVKRHPGKYTYGTPGVGGIAHLWMELLKLLTGTSIVHIPFRGAGPALIAVTSGQVDIITDALPSALPFIKAGRLTPLAVAAPSRVPSLPNIPTFAELGLAQLNFMSHFGILGPKNLPHDIVERINAATRQAEQEPEVKKVIEDNGAILVGSTPEEFAVEIKNIYGALKRVVIERKLSL